MHVWIELLRKRPSFRRLWLSGVISLVGDWMGFVAVSLLTVGHGGGALGIAVLLAAHALPHALLSPVAGVVADRMDRTRLMVIANVLEGALTLVAAAAAAHDRAALVILIVLVRGAVGAFVVPAETAALRRVVDEGELLPANALVSATWSVAFVVGMAVGGALAVLGPSTALAIDATSFFVAAGLLRSLPAIVPDGAAAAAPRSVRAAFRAVTRDLREGLHHAVRSSLLVRAVFAKSPIALAAGSAWVTLNLVAADVHPLGTAALSLGIIQAVRGAGTGLGPLVGEIFLRRGHASGRVLHVAAFVTLASMAAFSVARGAAALLVTALLWGGGSGANWVVSTSDMQRLSSDRYMGRLAAIDNLATTFAQVVGALAGGALIAVTGAAPHAAWLGISMGGAAWLALSRATAVSAPINSPPHARLQE